MYYFSLEVQSPGHVGLRRDRGAHGAWRAAPHGRPRRELLPRAELPRELRHLPHAELAGAAAAGR